nr:rhodanese-like domain-containing protein [Myxococcota bacterium]
GAEVSVPPAPSISISAAATKVFEKAVAEAGQDLLHLQIDSRFHHELFFGPREPGDIEVDHHGLTLLLDPSSARRANGVSINFIDGPNNGFKIDNPNAPAIVKQLSAGELKTMLDRGEITLFDVRPENERAIARIAAARALDAVGQSYLSGLDRNTPIALHCHHGIRSQEAGQQLLGDGFRNVFNLNGGIDAWSDLVDPSVPRY